MRAASTLALVAAALTGTMAAGAASASPNLKIKDAVVRVVVIPENRADIKVETLTTNASLPLTVRVSGEEVIVDGDLRMSRINGCNTRDGKVSVKVRGVGEVAYDDIPRIAVRMPLNVRVAGGGAVFGDIGRSDSVNLGNAGCGSWTVANTKGRLEVSQAGSGDVRTGAAGALEVSLAGSGNVKTKAVAGDVEVSIAGSGDVTVASLSGALEGNILGSGDITVAGGRARSVEVNLMGSGDVRFNGEADSVEVSVAGSGDVRIAKVNGPVRKHVAGSGDVIIGQ